MVAIITYGRTEDLWDGYEDFYGFEHWIKTIIHKYNFNNILEVGGGANPILSSEYVRLKRLNFTIMDISEVELLKAPHTYKKIVADISSRDLSIEEKFDFVFSKMVLEHVSNIVQTHKNIFRLVKNDGMVVHFFPTLYVLPFLVNKILPWLITDHLLQMIAPRDKYQHDKFPAHYHWCRGPSRASLRRIKDLGYEIIEYRGLYGHKAYYRKILPLALLHKYVTSYLLKHPNPFLTSYACIFLRKP